MIRTELVIAAGAMGSGKTTFCRKYAEENNYKFIDFDKTFSLSQYNFDTFLDRIASMVSTPANYILDGWFAEGFPDDSLARLKEKVRCKIKLFVFFAPAWLIQKRYLEKGGRYKKKNMEVINRIYNDIHIDVETIFIDTTDFEYKKYTYKEFIKMWKEINREYTEQDIINFISDLKRRYGTALYQDIDLCGYRTNGYKDCHSTWNAISSAVEWKDKTVLDVGCYMGYFCFKIKEKGAKKVVGIDINYLDDARKIRSIKRENVIFREVDIERDEIEDYDIILLLNTLHHLRSPFHVMRKIFKHSKIAIFEIEQPHNTFAGSLPIVEMGPDIKLSNGSIGGHLRFSKEMVRRVAKECGHTLLREIPSQRPHRTILIFQQEKWPT
ncbi:MAG: methyltransferase domain-containing protein [Candidatus Syntropharchaeia archaeon]